jgi:branched-chain amino acid transport system permease protein
MSAIDPIPLVSFADLIVGLSLGSRLFLIAVGLSLIFGVLGVLNFAHGGLYMIGAYLTLLVVSIGSGNFWLGVVVAALGVGVLGVALEILTLRPLEGRLENDTDQLLVTFGAVLIIHEGVRTIFGSQSYTLSPPTYLDYSIVLQSGQIGVYRLVVIGFALTVMLGLWLFITRTYFGSLVRGTASDREMAGMLGVNVRRLYTGVFFLGSVLAGLGGALSAPLQSTSPALGDQIIIDAFIVVVIGGLGSISGAFVGAMFIGLAQSLGPQFISSGSIAIPFLAMVLVLLFRPRGLFGGVAE